MHDVGPAEAPGVVVRERAGLEIATVIARGGPAALAARPPGTASTCRPPEARRVRPRRLRGDRAANLARHERCGGRLSDELQRKLADTAAVCDQSDGYAVMRLWGDKVRATFEKGLGIDPHPRVRPGRCGRNGLRAYRRHRLAIGRGPTYEIAVFRSLAAALALARRAPPNSA